MKVVIAGGSGFLGRALCARLLAAGHTVTVLSRGGGAGLPRGVRVVAWRADGTTGAWASEIDGADAVVNLAGAGIADRRWNAARKQLLRDSRVQSTRSLVDAVRAATRRPPVFIQGSAVGFYGAFDNGPALDESASPGSDLLGSMCVEWEAQAQPLASLGCRLVVVRTGIVLSREGGALAKMMTPFRLFVGGPIGSGRQVISWVHLDDWIGIVLWAIANPAVSGPINATAPHPATNGEFSHALGRAMGRPSWFPVPGFVLRIVVGEMAEDGLLRGQRVLPARTLQLGYQFHYPDIDEAMKAAVRQ
jgi:uncharacterized protein (TIGR01777 family)